MNAKTRDLAHALNSIHPMILCCSKQDNGATTGATSSGTSALRPPVLLMHALMQDSEAFLCGSGDHSLALFLADQGFDVWLGACVRVRACIFPHISTSN